MARIGEHKKIHLIGIGGCSMSGIAQILLSRGYEVQGSDANESPFTQRLGEMGIPVTIGHDAANVGDAELIIYSAAIRSDNVEREAAHNRGIPELERSEALGQLSEGYANVLGIAGCHGKTTITSMLALICGQGSVDATIHIGGYTEFLNGGVKLGHSDIFITEACEYVESFLTLKPNVALINNIDDDHLDYYRDIDHITEAFQKYLALLPYDGLFIANTDDERVRGLYEAFPGEKISYGMDSADYTPRNIVYNYEGNPSFDLYYKNEFLGRIALNVPGEHSIINAIAAAVCALLLGADINEISAALARFRNTRRRFEFYGERNNVRIYHDYAHHPAEISAVLDAASRVPHNRLWCVFQCNSYTRAKTLFVRNVHCFAHADEILVPDIFPGREKDDGSVHARDMVRGITESGANAQYVATFEMIREHLDANAKPGDIVITLGSGDVYKQTYRLIV